LLYESNYSFALDMATKLWFVDKLNPNYYEVNEKLVIGVKNVSPEVEIIVVGSTPANWIYEELDPRKRVKK